MDKPLIDPGPRRKTPRCRRLLLAAAVVTAGILTGPAALAVAPTPSPSAGATPPGGYAVPPSTFGIGPANDKAADGRPYLTFSVQPGAQISDHVAVANISTKPLRLGVYSTTVANNTKGDFAFADFGAKPTDAALWLHIVLPGGGSMLTIPARTTAILPVVLTLPANASPGDHSAGVVADLTTSVKTQGSPTGINTTLHQRVGVRVFIRVAGPIHPGLKIEKLHASYHGSLNPVGTGYSNVTYTVHNIGNVNLGATQSVEVHGLFGSTVHAKGLADIPLLLPGASVTQTVRVSGVFPDLHETATVRLTPEHLPSDVDPGLTNTTDSTGFWAIPWVLIGVIVLLIGIALLERRRRRRKRERSGRPATPRTAPVAADVPSGVPS